jgi:hypothetical protein
MDEMDDYYRNKISLCPKYIEWTRLPDEEKMVYCKKTYCKPVDEINVNVILINYLYIYSRCPETGTRRGRHNFCLSYPTKGMGTKVRAAAAGRHGH